MSIDIEHEDSLDSALSGQSQDERLLQSAADTLRGYACELMLSHTLANGEWPDGEEGAKAHHDHMMALACKLNWLEYYVDQLRREFEQSPPADPFDLATHPTDSGQGHG